MAENRPIVDYETARKAVQKYHSDNIALDKEFSAAYPSTAVDELNSMSREDKINKVAEAHVKWGDALKQVTRSVENLDTSGSSEGTPIKSDKMDPMLQMLAFMQQQAAAAEERARQERAGERAAPEG